MDDRVNKKAFSNFLSRIWL